MKLARKIVTFRSWLNKLLRQPQKVVHQRLDTGLVVVIEKYKNKQIIKPIITGEVETKYKSSFSYTKSGFDALDYKQKERVINLGIKVV